jgi:Tfp pilus assembly protein PilZ
MPPTGGPVSVVGARLLNVSPYGMLIESPMAMTADSVMQFRLVVGGEKTDVEARVAACTAQPGTRRAYGIGLEFTAIDDGIRERLREILAGVVA